VEACGTVTYIHNRTQHGDNSLIVVAMNTTKRNTTYKKIIKIFRHRYLQSAVEQIQNTCPTFKISIIVIPGLPLRKIEHIYSKLTDRRHQAMDTGPDKETRRNKKIYI